MIRLKPIVFAGCLATFLGPVSIGAQTPEETPAARARLRFGPLALEPKIALRNLGVDTNALNASAAPERDLTATITPELEEWLRIGRAALWGKSSVDWNYFQKLTGQRSFNGAQDGRVDLALGYVQPYLTGGIARTRQRPNFEIDARVERTVDRVGGGLIVFVGPKLSLDLSQERRRLDFGGAELGAAALADALNRNERETRLTGRYVLTPLTTLVATASHRRDRFEFAAVRDTDTVMAMAGFEFKPLALLSGRASVGWRAFNPEGPDLPAFRGVVSDVEVGYLIRDVTRLTVGVARDLDYSFELTEPYYVSTGLRAMAVQALGQAWDVIGRAERTTLDYRRLASAVPVGGPVGDRVDRVVVLGGGIGRRLGTDVRVGLDLDHGARRSSVDGRDYDAWRVGGSVTYGF